ncbi:sodium-dependent lysophosphatidylcholine symporter 1-A-like isoform X1 [Branchiostoma floridae x Branchiostoma japonicum]
MLCNVSLTEVLASGLEWLLATGESQTLTRRSNHSSATSRHPVDKITTMPKENPKPLHFWNNVCYGLSAVALSITGNAIGLFFPVFILEVAQITPAQNSILTITAKVVSSVSGFFVGFLVEATNTRWGKLKPWLFLTTFPAAACYFFLWFSPDIVSPTGKLIWYLAFYGGFKLLMRGFGNARSSLVMFATQEPRERDTLNTYSSAFDTAAILLSTLIQQGTFALFHADIGYDPCGNGTLNGTHAHHGPSLDTEKTAYMTAGAVGTGIFVVCGLAAVLGVPERKDISRVQRSSCFPAGDIKELVLHPPFLAMAVINLLLMLGLNTKQNYRALLLQYTFNLSDQVFYIIIVYTVASIVATFVWSVVMRRIGRKETVCLGILVFLLPNNAALLIATEELLGSALLPFMYAVTVWGGIGDGSFKLILSVMKTDVIDNFKLKTDKKMASILYSLWGSSSIVMNGISTAVFNWILQSANYNADDCVQPNRVKQALRYITAGTPPAAYVIALLFVWLYPITEESRMRTKMALDARRTAADEERRTLLNNADNISVQERL